VARPKLNVSVHEECERASNTNVESILDILILCHSEYIINESAVNYKNDEIHKAWIRVDNFVNENTEARITNKILRNRSAWQFFYDHVNMCWVARQYVLRSAKIRAL
jgi:hypothetical protein